MKNKKIIGGVIIVLIVAGLSFWGGMMYAGNNIKAAAASRQGAFNQNGFGGQNIGSRGGAGMRGGVNGGGLVLGEIIGKDDKSVTVKLSNGGSKIVFFSPTTKVEKTVDGLATDVVIGKQVMINGVANQDGSVNANSIQIRPIVVQAKTN